MESVLQHFKERSPKAFWIFEPDPRDPSKNVKGDTLDAALEAAGLMEVEK